MGCRPPTRTAGRPGWTSRRPDGSAGVGRQAERLADGALHLLRRGAGIDVVHDLLAAEDVQRRAGLVVVVAQAGRESLRGVVGAGDELAAADVAAALDLGPVGDEVVVHP